MFGSGGDAVTAKTYDYVSMGFITFDCLGWPFTAVPPGGGCYFIDELTLAVSGAAGVAAIAAAKMGLKTRAVGGVGEDLMGDWVLERLRHFGVDISMMQHKPGWKTSSSIVTTRADGSRPALHMKGATGSFVVDEKDFAKIADAKVVHLGGIGLMDAMDGEPNARLSRYAKEHGCITTVDIFAGSRDDLPDVAAVLPYTDYFIPSIEEAQALSGIEDLEDCTKFFHDYGVACCVFTLGADGAYYSHVDGTRFRVPAFDVEVKCTCGCGDAFDSGFAVALCHEFDPDTAVRFAQATAALNATGLGSQAGVESFEHTLNFMKTVKTKS
jgi:sugar/nucleoside kinase (ribokinase family)